MNVNKPDYSQKANFHFSDPWTGATSFWSAFPKNKKKKYFVTKDHDNCSMGSSELTEPQKCGLSSFIIYENQSPTFVTLRKRHKQP